MPRALDRTERSLPSLIDDYGRRVCAAVLEQHPGNSVASPLGTWLLLAACASATTGADMEMLEEVLGCSTAEAAVHLRRFLDDPPPALLSALALWVRKEDLTTPLVEWSASLPSQVERGPLPSQAAADAWTDRHSLGLIPRFPLRISDLTRLLLVSVLATKVSWERSFDVVRAADHLSPSSPWADRLERALMEELPGPSTMLAATEAAGVVAVHLAQAVEELAVLSVVADPAVERAQVLEAAHELARLCRDDALASARVSLFDLPLGRGHSWEITEHERLSTEAGRSETVTSAVLVAWDAENSTDLRRSPVFGADVALAALLNLIGTDPRGDTLRAVQSARASYSTVGFEAAAADVFFLEARGISRRRPDQSVIERRVKLLFDHPYAALALAGGSNDFRRARAGHSENFCLPLFAAWVAEPSEAQGEISPWAGMVPYEDPHPAGDGGVREARAIDRRLRD